jgi:hypothetical protein
MAQTETSAPEYLSDIARQNVNRLAAIQRPLLDALNKANQEWLNCLNEAGEVNSNLSKKVTTANSLPEMTAAYQEWTTKQLDLIMRQTKATFENAQNFAKTCTCSGSAPASSSSATSYSRCHPT